MASSVDNDARVISQGVIAPDIADKCSFVNTDGVYTLTIPASMTETGYNYLVTFTDADTNYYYLSVRCGK